MSDAEELMAGVVEYYEGAGVYLVEHEGNACVKGYNEGGHNAVVINLADLITWLRVHQPEVIGESVTIERLKKSLAEQTQSAWDRGHSLGIMRAELVRLRAERDDSRKRAHLFGEIMAVIHRDGGHYLTKHGPQKAYDDAVAEWNKRPTPDDLHYAHDIIKRQCASLKDENEQLKAQLDQVNALGASLSARIAELEAKEKRSE